MPYSKQQTPDPLDHADSSIPRPVDAVASDFNRSILGIPAEDDEFTRGLIFSFDPSTGLPSVPSTSQESEDPDENYEYSQPSNNTSSVRIFTPQSVSDASSGLNPRSAPAQSVASSDGGSSVNEADNLQSLSVSLKVAARASEAASSTKLTQTPTYLPMTGVQSTLTKSLEVDSSSSDHSGNPEKMNDPRVIIDIGPNDIEYLANILRQEDPSRLGIPAQALDPMDLVDDSIGQSTTSPQPELAQSSEYAGLHESVGIHTGAGSKGKGRISQPGHKRRASSKDNKEHLKLMRQIGSCLPCLVNHESVSVSDKYPYSRAALTLEV